MENKSQSPVITKKHSLADIRFPSPGSVSTHGCGMMIFWIFCCTIPNIFKIMSRVSSGLHSRTSSSGIQP